jgi:hypothetical protein
MAVETTGKTGAGAPFGSELSQLRRPGFDQRELGGDEKSVGQHENGSE